jgi:hypothetical protein
VHASPRGHGHDRVWLEQQGELREVPAFHPFARPQRDMNPWAVVGDWGAAGDARVVGLCPYRDDDRLVLERTVRGRPERLFLDRESGFPVKLDRTVPHETWGQLHEEVLWSTWIEAGGEGFLPAASFRIRDGEVDMERTVGEVELMPAADAALPGLPADVQGVHPGSILGDPEAMRPDTVRIGDGAFLLARRMYPEAVVASGDTVWITDATLNEARARQDSAWVIRHIGGLSSEGALMALDRRSRFLWAGDWIQMTDQPSMYAAEVVQAAAREGFEPARTGAEHIPITDWSSIVELNPVVR